MARLCRRIGAGILSLVLILTMGLVMVPKQVNASSHKTVTSVKLIGVELPSKIEDFDHAGGQIIPSQFQINDEEPLDIEGDEFDGVDCRGFVMVETEEDVEDVFDGKKWIEPIKYEVGKEYAVRFM